MMLKLAPSLLLSILCCSDEVAAFNNAARPAVVASRWTGASLSMSNANDFDRDYDVEVDRRGNIKSIDANDLGRRGALGRFAGATAAATLLGMSSSSPAFAADAKPPTEFSPAPTSKFSIARTAYDGNGAPPAPAAAPEAASAPAQVEAPPESTPSPVTSKFEPKISLPRLSGISSSSPRVSGAGVSSSVDLSNVDPRLVYGAVAVGLIAAAANVEEENPEERTDLHTWTPYGLAQGKNYEGGAFVADPLPPVLPKPAPLPPSPAPAVKEDEDRPAWSLPKATPYGIQNPDGKNPFLKDVKEYCEGGKVTEPCVETIKGYLDNIADTGAVATSEEVKAIAGYLDSLGGSSTTPSGKKAGAAFASYLDALSAGSAPPPSSAKAVKTYLDTIAGNVASPKSAQREPMESPIVAAPAPEPVAAVQQGPDLSEFDSRLTNIEGRVSSLETKVDQLPDQVFAKIEAWQSKHEERLSDEVKKIVEALGQSSPAAPAVMDAPASEEPVAAFVEEPEPVPEPIVQAAPAVSANPLVGAIPERFGIPRAGSNTSGPKKGYGFGGGASWKTGKSAPVPAPTPAAAATVVEAVPVPVPEPVTVAPVKFATPLAGAIPERTSVPRAGSKSSPGKSYGFSKGGAGWKTSAAGSNASPGKSYGFGKGGAGWKTSAPRSGGGGYLDNMGP